MISLILLKRKFTVTIDKGYLLLGFPYDLIDNGIIEGDAVSYLDYVICLSGEVNCEASKENDRDMG